MGALRLENGKLLRHFGLASEPFHVSPRRRDFFPATAAPAGMAALVEPDGGRARLVTITGEPGTGRTSALRRLATELRADGWLVFMFETAAAPHPEHLSQDDIFHAACRTFGLHGELYARAAGADADADGADVGLSVLRARALERPAHSPIAIIIDDAGRLARRTLEGMVRLVVPAFGAFVDESACVDEDVCINEDAGGVASSGPAALGLVLGGTPALVDQLAEVAPEVARSSDGARGFADVRLSALAHDDVAAYVEHCLSAAGFQGRELFDATAIDRLAEKSGGNLGEINALGAPAMIFAWQASRQSISADLIDGSGIGVSAPPAIATAEVETDESAGVPAPAPLGTAVMPVGPRRSSSPRRTWVALGLACLVMAGLAGTVGTGTLFDGFAGLRSTPAVVADRQGIADTNGAAPATGATPPGGAVSPAGSGADLVSARSVEPGADAPADATRSGEANADALVERGEALLRGADAVSARRFFARAAESGSAAAAAAMAASYDPLYLAQNAIRGVEADPEQAASWYRVAIARGDGSAQDRLSALMNSPNHL